MPYKPPTSYTKPASFQDPPKQPETIYKGKPNQVSQYVMADPEFLNAKRDLQYNLSNYRTQNLTDRSMLKNDYADTLRRMQLQHGQDTTDRSADFASRGLIGSGLDLANFNQFQNEYNQQRGDAQTSKQRNLNELITDWLNAKTMTKQQIAAERLKAIQRASARYGITG